MSLRLVELRLPASEDIAWIKELLEDHPTIDNWESSNSEDHHLIQFLIEADKTEAMLDILEKRYSNTEGFRIMLIPVEATIPRPIHKPKEPEPTEPNNDKKKITIGRISREELYTDISDTAGINTLFVVFVVLSAIVASIGILKNNVAIIIGAMVIAPMLGSNMTLAFGTTLGDMKLLRRSMEANLLGFAVAFGLSYAIGLLYDVDIAIEELASRTNVGFGDIALALASGVAGALSFTKGIPGALIGVMVAVALLPPTVSFGMLMGSAQYTHAMGALQLLLVNVICVNLSAVLTFLIQGVRPLTWWQADRAKKSTSIAITLWVALLLILAVTIYFSRSR